MVQDHGRASLLVIGRPEGMKERDQVLTFPGRSARSGTGLSRRQEAMPSVPRRMAQRAEGLAPAVFMSVIWVSCLFPVILVARRYANSPRRDRVAPARRPPSCRSRLAPPAVKVNDMVRISLRRTK
jgi:hypothetical protein